MVTHTMTRHPSTMPKSKSTAPHVISRSVGHTPSRGQERAMSVATWVLIALVLVCLVTGTWWGLLLLALAGGVYVAFVLRASKHRHSKIRQ